MEQRPAPLRSRRVCRFCLTESETLSFIYEKDHSKPFQVPLTLQIMSCVSIEVYAADGMPQMICTTCRWNMDRSYRFKIQCKKADEALRAYPISGVLPRPFAPIPCVPPEVGNKRSADQRAQSDQNKKPRIDSVERERRDQREREKEEHHDMYEEEHSEADQEILNEKPDSKLEPGEIRVHACDQCDRTFPLRQSLQLHVQRAHRDRTHKCTECDKMFFSKYDLSKHMSTHSEDKPFSCPICNKQFSRANLLQRHEKVHREELRYGCQHCDREFFTTDELEKHEDMNHKNVKKYQCNICNKRFTYKQGLERHELMHSEDKSFVCEYCKEAFRTSTKLARHLTTHSGHRPYLCKLCPRSFLLSHHLTRHMRSHDVEKPHVCEECGKAFKRKESLEVHQLTHAKRGMGLTCDVCQESCRNRADYVTHIKQHIEAGEKMGPDGLRPDSRKDKIDSESEEEEDDEQFSDGGDDDYEPPAYIVKKIPKTEPPESDEEMEKEERKEQVVYVRNKDGNMIKKTIKTLMPIQRREIQESKIKSSSSKTPQESRSLTPEESVPLKTRCQNRVDETEAQVQKIVASVFKEHKIPLKHQTSPQEVSKETQAQPKPQQVPSKVQSVPVATPGQTSKEPEQKADIPGTPSTPKTVKVIKRIVVRKPAGASDNASVKDGEGSSGTTSQSTPGTGPKVTKRVIVRRIIRQGDTTREVIMNPDGTIIDAAELAKLPPGNVVKRVIVKKPMEKFQSSGDQRAAVDSLLHDAPKFELKTSQTSSTLVVSSKSSTAPAKQQEVGKSEHKEVESVEVVATEKKGDQDTKDKLEQLEKRVEQQRLKIEELQARKQQEVEPDEMLPERHDESEDEQTLPLKRVFVKRKQSIYDEEQEYDSDEKVTSVTKVKGAKKEGNNQRKDYRKPTVTSTSKVYGNKKVILVKADEASQPDDSAMTRELTNILDSTETVVKMQESVLSNLSQISALEDPEQKNVEGSQEEERVTEEQPMESNNFDESTESEIQEVPLEEREVDIKTEVEGFEEVEETVAGQEQEEEEEYTQGTQESQPESLIPMDGQDISESTETYPVTNSSLEEQKPEMDSLGDNSVIELPHGNDTINLNDSTESQDSIEDKLSQLESGTVH